MLKYSWQGNFKVRKIRKQEQWIQKLKYFRQEDIFLIHFELHYLKYILGSDYKDFPGGTSGKETACQCRKFKRLGFNPWVRKVPWRRAWQPTPVLAWRIPWTEEPGGLRSIRSQTVIISRKTGISHQFKPLLIYLSIVWHIIKFSKVQLFLPSIKWGKCRTNLMAVLWILKNI